MKRILLSFSILVFLLTINVNRAYCSKYKIKSITSLNGLSQNDVQCIFQDRQGFIWVGTNDGLNKFDGYEFKTFGINDLGLTSNLILSIDEDKDGDLWISTANKGIFIYYRDEHKFVPVSFRDSKDKSDINGLTLIIDNNNRIWVNENNANKLFSFIYNKQRNSIESNFELDYKSYNLSDLKEFNNSIVAATSNGVMQYSIEGNQIKSKLLSSFKANIIEAVNQNEFIFAGEHKLLVFNAKTRVERNLLNISGIKEMVYKNHRIYYATKQGIFRAFIGNDYSIKEHEQVAAYENNNPTSMIIGRYEALWVGFLKNGIIHVNRDKKEINEYSNFENNLMTSICSSFDPDQFIVGTEGSGIFNFDNSSKKTVHLPIFRDCIVYCIAKSQCDKTYYAGVQSKGLVQFDEKGNILKLNLTLYDIRSILPDGRFLWLATYNKGLYRYDTKNNELIEIKNNDKRLLIVRNLVTDSNGNIWVATGKGIKIITKSNRLSTHPSVSDIKNANKEDYVIPIMEDKDKNIWYGTLGRGLIQITEITEDLRIKTKKYTKEQGLSSNSIKAIQQDNQGRLWISTNRGINCIDLQSMHVNILDYEDGIQDYEFNELSSYKNKKGILFFGGVKGLNSFDPSAFKLTNFKFPPILTDLMLFNKSVTDNPEYMKYFPKEISRLTKIELPYDMNCITFIFSALDYMTPKKNRYEYILEGVDKKWIKTGTNIHEAPYTFLPPGNYIFKLRIYNSNEKYDNSQILSIPVTIFPPYWLSWYAYLIYLSLMIIFFFLFIRYYKKRMERKHALYIANIEKKKSEEMLEMKTTFFTNVSHELRTPLTLIYSPLQIMKKNPTINEDPSSRELIEIMEHNSNLLLRHVNELLDFSKNESDKLTLNLRYLNIVSFLKENIRQFKYWSEQKGITISYSFSEQNISMFFDPHLMEQVIYNLISNAIKHTPKGGFVSISLFMDDTILSFSVSDSGEGIPEEKKEHIFERFYSDPMKKSSGGTGIGLYLTQILVKMHNGKVSVISKPERGTVFTVEIPIIRPEIDTKERLDVKENVMTAKSIDTIITDDEKNDTVITDCQINITTDGTDNNTYLPLIFVVDDNEVICKMLELVLNGKYRTAMATDGKQAWKQIPEMLPDMVISDVMMPEMNGFELCEKIKTDERTSHIPVILLTAKSSNQDAILGYRFQADAYCVKPFNNDLMLEMINSMLNNRKRINKFKSSIVVQPSEVTVTSTDEKFMQKLIAIIEKNMQNSDFLVNDLCEEVGLTSLALNKKLKALVGTTANSFIRSIHLKRAASLLKTGRYSVSEVTYEVGFNDLKYFRECFKKEFGILPQDFKNSNIKEEEHT